MTKNNNLQLNNAFLAVLTLTGFIWLRSSFGKVTGGEFVEGMPKTIGFFASKNPHPFIQNFLNTTAMSNSMLFGNLVMWGEVLVALALFGAALFILVTKNVNKNVLTILLLGLLGGMLMNLVFWFAAGWTSPSTESINLLMFGVQLIGFWTVLKALKTV